MTDLQDLTALHGRDLILGGIVTAVREGYTKGGKPYGVAKMEDYTGVAEFAFFGNDWLDKKNYFAVGMFLFMRGKCQPRQWNKDQWEVRINSVELLSDAKDHVIERLTVTAPLDAVDDDLLTEISELAKQKPGNTELAFIIRDDDNRSFVNLVSRKLKISVEREFVNYIKSRRPTLDYKIN